MIQKFSSLKEFQWRELNLLIASEGVHPIIRSSVVLFSININGIECMAKKFNQTEDGKEQYVKELRALEKNRHENIIKIIGRCEDENNCIIMERAKGTLRDFWNVYNSFFEEETESQKQLTFQQDQKKVQYQKKIQLELIELIKKQQIILQKQVQKLESLQQQENIDQEKEVEEHRLFRELQVQSEELQQKQKKESQNLEEILKNRIQSDQNKNNRRVIERKIHELSLQIAKGLEFLHSKDFYHLDINPQNILILGDWTKEGTTRAVLSDFGESRTGQIETVPIKRLTKRYAAPEVFRFNKGRSPADMYSFGCVLYFLSHNKEVFGEEDEWDDLKLENMHKSNSPQRPKINDNLSQWIKELIQNTWKSEESERETASQIVNRLEKALVKQDWKCRKHGTHQHKLFISYRKTKEDTELVRKLFEGIEKKSNNNITVFWDDQCLNFGEDWEVGFCQGMMSCLNVVTILTVNSIKTINSNVQQKRQDNVLLEIEMAMERFSNGEISVFPIIVFEDEENGSDSQSEKMIKTSVFQEKDTISKELEHVKSGLKVRATLDQLLILNGLRVKRRDFERDAIEQIFNFINHSSFGSSSEIFDSNSQPSMISLSSNSNNQQQQQQQQQQSDQESETDSNLKDSNTNQVQRLNELRSKYPELSSKFKGGGDSNVDDIIVVDLCPRFLKFVNRSIDEIHLIELELTLSENILKIKKFDMGKNNIGDYGANILASVLKKNSTLEVLELKNNNIGDKGAESLSSALKINTSLRELHLGKNNISDFGGEALSSALKINTSLIELNINFNNLSQFKKSEIKSFIERNIKNNKKVSKKNT